MLYSKGYMKNTSSLRRAFHSLKIVFQKPRYSVLTLVVALLMFSVSLWLPNRDLINYILTSDAFSGSTKIKILGGTFASFQTLFTLPMQTTILLTSFLAGVNIALLIYYIRRRTKLEKSVGVSVLGMISGFFGVGCASCGSVLLSSLFGLSATAGFLGILPFHGLEFGLLGIALLMLSIFLVAKKIEDPLTCRVPVSHSS